MPSLFDGQSLSDYFETTVVSNVIKDIDNLPEGQFLSSTDEEIIIYIFSKHEIIPLQIFEDAKYARHEDIKVRYKDDHNREYDGLKFNVMLPFAGNSELWYLKPSRYVANFPEGSVLDYIDGSGILVFDIGVALNQDIDTSNKLVDKNLNYIKSFIAYQKEDIERFNASIKDIAKTAINTRRRKLAKKTAMIKAFKVPLKRSPNAPDITKIPITRKLIKPLPSVPNTPSEYGISDDDYKHIIEVIRYVGGTFESTPKTFAMHDEEGLRDIILANLNGHYERMATGETFRKYGKTDIKVDFENKAAFVGECKVWRGEKGISEAIGQLLGYLTWRDCKTAIVIFNKEVKGFKTIQEKVPEIFLSHKNYLQTLPNQPAGEWRYIFKSRDDEERQIMIHVFLFDLHVNPAGGGKQ